MRMSDWSSDVCSSDRTPTIALPSEEAAVGVQRRLAAEMCVEHRGCRSDLPGLDQIDQPGHGLTFIDRVEDDPFEPAGQGDRIDRRLHRYAVESHRPSLTLRRASCRERGCPYV